ncbi:MAG: HPr family phosphocarrier protein [Actinomycetaceae bacterium]|nr:HPr family phosphocarrier protein [Actinomycetaceae bacterium]
MAEKTVVVGSSVGLHARPATLVAEAADEFDDDILLFMEGDEGDEDEGVDAASALLIMTLGAKHGDRVVVRSDNAEAVEKVAAMIEKDLDA